MADFDIQIDEIETLLSCSSTQAEKSLGYATLVYLQQQSTEQTSLIDALARRLPSLLSSIIYDISVIDDDEEIAAQALKCLGFTVYHPSLVSAIPEDIAYLVVESLVKLITTTKIKAICNLGVWCISIQQFNTSFLLAHFHYLLRAVIHALDNPSGSLSTTFEAIQAVIKLVAQLSQKMRETSNMWAPAIYKRLLNIDKRERDMAERCFLKIRSVLLPPPLVLSKALVTDIKKRFLSEMKEMVKDHGRKIQTVQAWGWFIRLLGSYAMKNRHLVNEMLKIPEQTFSHSDPQVQIASLVAWEGAIDALIHPCIEAAGIKITPEQGVQQNEAASWGKRNTDENQADGLSKSMRLIMTPLVGIMSSKCDISVHSSCLNTWHYLLHKLDLSVNCPSVVKMVIQPILEVVFQMGPSDNYIWPWNFCLDLLDGFILSNSKDIDDGSNCQVRHHLSIKASSLRPSNGIKSSWKDYPIKWLPWDLSKLDFHLKMIHVVINQGTTITSNLESRSLACNAALRIFRSVLKGLQTELKSPSIKFDEIMSCLKKILSLIKQFSEDATSRECGSDDFLLVSINFIEVVMVELEHSFLSSPLYRVDVDLKDLQLLIDAEYPEVPEIISIKFMDKVSPMVYLTVLHLCLVAQSFANALKMEPVLHGLKKHLEFSSPTYDLFESIHVSVNLLYKHRTYAWLKVWIVIADCLKEYIDVSSLKIETGSASYVTVLWFLSYPIVVFLDPHKRSTLIKSSSCEFGLASSSVELEHVINIWTPLYSSLTCFSQSDCSNMNSFPDDLSGILAKILSVKTGMTESVTELFSDSFFLPLSGDVAVCLLNHLLVIGDEKLGSKGSNKSYDDFTSSGIRNTLDFVARFMRLSLPIKKSDPDNDFSVILRVFSALASFARRLHLRQDIVIFMEMFSDTLLNWLSMHAVVEMQKGSQTLWIEILNCLQRSQPHIIFDTSFLEVQAPLLETTLEHPNPAISEPTIVFWNNTYGNQIKLDFPQSLLPVLDKLSRKGRINIRKKNLSFRGIGLAREVIPAPPTFRVATSQKRNSKRVEFTEEMWNDFDHTEMLMSGRKKKKIELTEHQKEVRRAQQGRGRDCGGHGTGVHMYTTADFSQGLEDSEDSQELRNPESILEMQDEQKQDR